MNIIVKTSGGRAVVRPDTTWEKDNEDFYPPEFVEKVTYSPVIFVRISKPGRSVEQKFASRYYDSVNFGVLLYPENLIDGSPEGFAGASCLDHTSFLPFPLRGLETLGSEGCFELAINGKEEFSRGSFSMNMIDQAIAEATRMIYIRTGDLLAIELRERCPLISRTGNEPDQNGTARVSAVWLGDTTLDFKVIL